MGTRRAHKHLDLPLASARVMAVPATQNDIVNVAILLLGILLSLILISLIIG